MRVFKAIFLGVLCLVGLSGSIAFSAVISPSELYFRQHSVLQYFQVPEETEDLDSRLETRAFRQTRLGFQSLLRFFDFSSPIGSQWNRFAILESAQLSVFQDRDSRLTRDFQVRLSETPTLPENEPYFQRLRLLQLNPQSLPLQGVRIALDPGHMGGDYWDRLTGKWVQNAAGLKLGEGTITLLTCLLLRDRLIELGADVMVTRQDFVPVTQMSYNALSIREFGKKELAASVHQPWFQQLLTVAPAGGTLNRAFELDPNVKAIFSENARGKYFAMREDLDARARLVEQFNPDLTLVVHFDASINALEPKPVNRTKAYVPGAFGPTEFATRLDRAAFVEHVTNPVVFDASVQLSRNLIQSIKGRLGTQEDGYGGEMVKPIEPGVFARNLALTRRLGGHAISYLEVMFYNTPDEFNRLIRYDFDYPVAGRRVKASNRVKEISQALSDGVLAFFKNYRSNVGSPD